MAGGWRGRLFSDQHLWHSIRRMARQSEEIASLESCWCWAAVCASEVLCLVHRKCTWRSSMWRYLYYVYNITTCILCHWSYSINMYRKFNDMISAPKTWSKRTGQEPNEDFNFMLGPWTTVCCCVFSSFMQVRYCYTDISQFQTSAFAKQIYRGERNVVLNCFTVLITTKSWVGNEKILWARPLGNLCNWHLSIYHVIELRIRKLSSSWTTEHLDGYLW